MARKKTRRGGAPRKSPDGFEQVLYIRTTREMLDGLDLIAARRRDETGLSVSRSDVARKILGDAISVSAPVEPVLAPV